MIKAIEPFVTGNSQSYFMFLSDVLAAPRSRDEERKREN